MTRRPIFILKIEFVGKTEFAIHALRKLLKSLIRGHHFRCLQIEEVEDHWNSLGQAAERVVKRMEDER